jgi:hypothetical protein
VYPPKPRYPGMVLVPDKLKTKKILKRQERERELKKGSGEAVVKGPSAEYLS